MMDKLMDILAIGIGIFAILAAIASVVILSIDHPMPMLVLFGTFIFIFILGLIGKYWREIIDYIKRTGNDYIKKIGEEE